jgi:hypothetical protein
MELLVCAQRNGLNTAGTSSEANAQGNVTNQQTNKLARIMFSHQLHSAHRTNTTRTPEGGLLRGEASALRMLSFMCPGLLVACMHAAAFKTLSSAEGKHHTCDWMDMQSNCNYQRVKGSNSAYADTRKDDQRHGDAKGEAHWQRAASAWSQQECCNQPLRRRKPLPSACLAGYP